MPEPAIQKQFLPTRLFALVIGINKYPGLSPERQLVGAVPDADAVVRYLKDSFNNPNITYLCDGAATREGIIKAFQSLRDNTMIQRDDAILIYYAGHGARIEKPSGPHWDSWKSLDSKVEMICPSDISTGPKESPICGIHDRTISALLNALSKKHGDNITLILDCCHSAGANRKFRNAKARLIVDPPPIPANCDDTIWSNIPTRGASVSIGFVGQDRESHVLLAACSRDEGAWEHEGRGLFTRALLKVLTGVNSNTLDYATLIRKLEDFSEYIPDISTQTPHCDGVHVNRILFDKHVAGGDISYIPGQVEKDGKIILNAGDAQSIWKGAQMEIYSSNFASTTNVPLGVVIVSDIAASKSTLGTATFELPSHFYAKLTQSHPDEKITVYCNEMEKLVACLNTQSPELTALGVVIVEKEDDADANVLFEGEGVFLETKEKPLSSHIRRRIPDNIILADVLLHILQAVVRFNFHLKKTNSSKRGILPDKIPMEFHQLEEDYDDLFQDIRKPGPNLIENGLATVTVKGQEIDGVTNGEVDFGFTIHNKTALLLHPYLFAFDSSDLSIKPLHLAPLGPAGNQRVDPLLLPRSTFPVGYGDGGTQPWSFWLPKTVNTDVTYFKLFVTTKPADFSFLCQESPFGGDFAGRGTHKKPRQVMQPDVWGTVMVTVVQQQ